MDQPLLHPAELRARGFEALVKSLGWVNAIRYVQQFERSRLDHTKERDTILPDWPVEELVKRAVSQVRHRNEE
jgi:hypothetical protein